MRVTSNQMHNAIACFCKQLSRARYTDQTTGRAPRKMAEELAIFPEITRNATMEKICRQVLDKIADVVELIDRKHPADSIAKDPDDGLMTTTGRSPTGDAGSAEAVSESGMSSHDRGGWNQSGSIRHRQAGSGQPDAWPGVGAMSTPAHKGGYNA